MPFFTRKDFAKYCKIADNYLRSAISKKKVVIDENGLIDSNDPVNIVFYEQKKAKWDEQEIIDHIKKVDGRFNTTEKPKTGKKQSSTTAKADTEYDYSDDDETDDEEIPSLDASTRKLKYLDTLKREKETALLALKEEKLLGTVIPSDLIKPILLQNNQSFIIEFKNCADEFIRLMAKKKDMTAQEVADIRGGLIKVINMSATKSYETSIKAIDLILQDFSETRGKGDRK